MHAKLGIWFEVDHLLWVHPIFVGGITQYLMRILFSRWAYISLWQIRQWWIALFHLKPNKKVIRERWTTAHSSNQILWMFIIKFWLWIQVQPQIYTLYSLNIYICLLLESLKLFFFQDDYPCKIWSGCPCAKLEGRKTNKVVFNLLEEIEVRKGKADHIVQLVNFLCRCSAMAEKRVVLTILGGKESEYIVSKIRSIIMPPNNNVDIIVLSAWIWALDWWSEAVSFAC